MKYQQKQKWKKRIAAIIALLIAIIMVMGLILPVFAAQTTTINAGTEEVEEETTTEIKLQQEIGKERFEMNVSAGFDGTYLVEHITPVLAEVTNLGQSFHGEIQAKVYIYEDMNILEYALYSQKLDLEQGNTKKIAMDLPLNTIVKAMEVTLIDEKGTVVYRKNVPMKAKRVDTMMVGVLSEHLETVQYFSEFQPKNVEKERSYTYFLDEKTFPVSEAVMQNFQAVVIDDFDTKRLSDVQRKTLQNWVSNGGLLLLGTGPQANKVLSGLDFVEVTIDGGSSVTTLSDMSGNTIVLSAPMQTADIKGETLYAQNNVLSKLKYGNGAVLIHHFALGLKPFSDLQNNTGLLANWYAVVEPLHFTENIQQNVNFEYLANLFPPFSAKSVYLMFSGIILYILLACPVVYYILKKKDKRELGWIVIPVLAVVFLGIMSVMTQNSPYKKNLFHSVAMVEMKENTPTAEAKVYMAMKSPKTGTLDFETEENIPVEPMYTRRYYRDNAQPIEECKYKVLYDDEKTDVTFYHGGTWETHTVTANTVLNLGGSVDCDVVFDGKAVKGSVTNHTNVHFVDALLEVGNFYVKIGEIPAGGTIQVNQTINKRQLKETSLYSQITIALYENEYGEDTSLMNLVNTGVISAREGYRLSRERDFVEQVRNAYVYGTAGWNNKHEICKFYGFSETPIFGGNKYINGKPVIESSINMYYASFQQDLSKVKEFDLPFSVFPSAEDFQNESVYLEYDSWDNSYNLTNDKNMETEVILPYNIGKDVRVDTIQFYLADDMYQNGLTQPSQIYNNKTQQWEELKDSPYTPAADYLNEKGQIQMKIFMAEHGYITVPKLRVKGGGLYA